MLSKKSKRSDLLIIALEGPDYSGKSTIAKFVVDKLNNDDDDNNKIKTTSGKYAAHFRRPGGSYACDSLRSMVIDMVMDSDTRQVLAFAEEVLFHYTVPPFHKLFLLDRFNPISGQIYGPENMNKHWRFLVESGVITIPDLVIFIDTPIDILLMRRSERIDKQDIMDDFFVMKANNIIHNYEQIKQDEWFNKHFNHITINNASSLEDVQSSVLTIIEKELRNKNV